MIYLDFNATTPVLPEVREAMLPFLAHEWGNPSSSYRMGARAKLALDHARAQVGQLLDASPSEIVFTSCATEANNAAIQSALITNPGKRHVVTSRTEHSSVLHFCEVLSTRGYDVTFLPVSAEGLIDLHELEAKIRPDTAVVSLMWANNETGVISPVHEIGKICAYRGVFFHCDAVQAAGKLPVSFGDTPIDFLTVSGHKLGAPKGVGALVLREGVAFHPLIVGGKQESGRRGGTESVPLIVALGVACEQAQRRGPNAWDPVAKLRDEFEEQLLTKLTGAYRNVSDAPRLPNTSNFGIRGVDSDSFVTFCDAQGVCVSSGSACMESAISPSHVLLAMTGSHSRASEALRISLGLETKREELTRCVTLLQHFLNLTQ